MGPRVKEKPWLSRFRQRNAGLPGSEKPAVDASTSTSPTGVLVLVGPSVVAVHEPAADARGAEDIDGAGSSSVTATSPTCRQGAGHRDGVPELCAHPHMTVGRTWASLKIAQGVQDEIQRGYRRPRRSSTSRVPARPQAEGVVGASASGRHGSRDVRRPGGVPDGRTAVEPRREVAGVQTRTQIPCTSGSARPRSLRHARPDRGHDDGRPRRSSRRLLHGHPRNLYDHPNNGSQASSARRPP